jgi:hypothetical protein
VIGRRRGVLVAAARGASPLFESWARGGAAAVSVAEYQRARLEDRVRVRVMDLYWYL